MTVAAAPADLETVDAALRRWQVPGAALQLHPGDVGWLHRLGAEVTTAALRLWRDGREPVAVGLLDGPVLRVAFAPGAERDETLARQVAAAAAGPVEAPTTALLHELLPAGGWAHGEAWTPLRRDLADAPPASGLRTEVVDGASADVWTEVTAASFGTQPVPQRWPAMTAGPAFATARCLLGRDADGTPVASVAVWSAGPGRPGLLEPMGVHPDHRGRGHGRAIVLAAAAALRELGASSADVCTPSANVGAVATYRAAGFVPLPERADLVPPSEG